MNLQGSYFNAFLPDGQLQLHMSISGLRRINVDGLGGPASIGGLDKMASRSSFQTQTSCCKNIYIHTYSGLKKMVVQLLTHAYLPL